MANFALRITGEGELKMVFIFIHVIRRSALGKRG
jgi:hypothetical protein